MSEHKTCADAIDRAFVPIPTKEEKGGKERNGSVTEMAASYGSASSIFRSPPTRPTQDEATALWEIMPTPSLVNSPLPEPTSDCKTSREVSKRPHSKANKQCPLVTPIGSPPNEVSMFSIPKIKNGPPYESTLPFERSTSDNFYSFSMDAQTVKSYPLLPRTSKIFDASSCQESMSKCIHHGLGPYLGTLPESIIYSICGYIDYIDRHPTLMLVSQGMTSILTRPEFLLELKAQKVHHGAAKSLLSQALEEDVSASNELLLVVGGKCPIKAGSNSNDGRLRGQSIGSNRRMTMLSNEKSGIMGYDLKREKWLRFGGDPMAPFKQQNNTLSSSVHINPKANLHPLSPMNIVDAKSIYVGHPHYSVMFFGGTHYETGLPSNRVIAFSFLTAKWEVWPDMMRARHGEDIILARVEPSKPANASSGMIDENSCNDSIVLIGCDLEFCDCYRCHPPPNAVESADVVDMINFSRHVVPFAAEGFTSRRVSNEDRRSNNHDTVGRCESLDLTTRTWRRREAKAPSCPPDDGGVAVLGGRFVYLPGTCPPPPSAASWHQLNERQSFQIDEEAEVVTPLSQSETSSQADLTEQTVQLEDDEDNNSVRSMDVEGEASDDEIIESSLSNLYRSLHYRPGLVYDAWLDQWGTLPPRPYVTTSSPTTFAFQNRVLVIGGYRSSSENALSCYRHREDDSILDYEDHLDYAWWYTPGLNSQIKSENEHSSSSEHNGKWTFGGGSSKMGHRQDFASSSDMAAAVAAATAMQLSSSCPDSLNCNYMSIKDWINDNAAFPFGAPVSVRGAAMTTYQGRLTLLGGLSTFSRTFYDSERKTIWQFYPETCEWRRASMELPAPALLDGYSFSLHI